MTDFAQIITHSPEQASQWRELATSNPGRVARTLALRIGQTTREGDNQGDIYPALQAVTEISMEMRSEVGNKAWENLVDGGIADALCRCVCEMVTIFQALPNMPQDLLEKVANEMQSPYHIPLEILCRASIMFQYPPTKTDKKVIAALRKNWSEMMDRIWNEPMNTLRPEDSHIRERAVVAQLLARVITTDPTFISILYEPSDLTIQIIARHWKYSRGPADTAVTASALCGILEPNHPRRMAYVRNNGLESATSKIVSKILLGVGPTALSSKQQHAKALMATFAEHLVRLTGLSAAEELEFVMVIILAAKKAGSESELAKAVLKATPLWNAMKSARPTPVNEDPESEKRHRLRIISTIVCASSSTLHGATLRHPKECEPLVRMWANENFFGALEETIEILVTMPGMTMQLSRLGSIIDKTVSEGTPSLLRVVRTQFPRWRLLGTLVRHEIERQQVVGPPPVPPSFDEVPPADSIIWDASAWQCFRTLQSRCIDKSACGKRGCENAGTILCSCKAVKYCSEACKTKDAKDHRLACTCMVLLEKNDITARSGPAIRAVSPQTQTPKRKKKNAQIPGRVLASPIPWKTVICILSSLTIVSLSFLFFSSTVMRIFTGLEKQPEAL